MLLFSLLSIALANPPEVEQLTWNLAIGEVDIGQRTARVMVLPEEGGTRRMVEVQTEVSIGTTMANVAWAQRLTVHATRGPAAFHAVLRDGLTPREIQARPHLEGWTVTVVEPEDVRTWDLPRSRIDLSTADLYDPQSDVSLDRFGQARMLSTETGEVFTVEVERLGASDLEVAGTAVNVQGYALHGGPGTTRLYYSDSGYLVRHETRILGKVVTATLTAAPPVSAEQAPLVDTVEIGEEDL